MDEEEAATNNEEPSLPESIEPSDNENEQEFANAVAKLKQQQGLRKDSLEELLSRTKSEERGDASNAAAWSSTTAFNKRLPSPVIESRPGPVAQPTSTTKMMIKASKSDEAALWKHEANECGGAHSPRSHEEHQKVIVRSESVPNHQKRCYKTSVDSSLTARQDNSVLLNVYGLSQFNQNFRFMGVGVYHSGVQVYGNEWAYGSFPLPISSIFMMSQPRDLGSLSNISGRFHFVKSIYIGRTRFNREEIVQIIRNMGKTEWVGTKYHMITKNCNNFSDEFCKALCNRGIPSWVNRLAKVANTFPFLIRLLPAEYFTPVALQKKLKREQELKYNLSKKIVAKKKKEKKRSRSSQD